MLVTLLQLLYLCVYVYVCEYVCTMCILCFSFYTSIYVYACPVPTLTSPSWTPPEPRCSPCVFGRDTDRQPSTSHPLYLTGRSAVRVNIKYLPDGLLTRLYLAASAPHYSQPQQFHFPKASFPTNVSLGMRYQCNQ